MTAGRITRRRWIAGVAGAAGASMAALLAACGGPSGDAFPPPRTPTPLGTAVYVPPPLAASPQPTGSVGAGASATVLPTARHGAPVPEFVRLLSFVPDDAGLHGGYLTVANPGAVRKLYAYDQVHSPADLQAQNIPPTDYANVLSGCPLSEFAGTTGPPGAWRDAFGYDSYDVDREIWAGRMPDAISHLEGAFDADGITAHLQMGRYAEVTTRSGLPYLAVRGDNEEDLRDARSALALGRMNRVAVARDRLIASPKTAPIEAALDTEARKAPALDGNATFRALAEALPNVTGLATAPPAALAPVAAAVPPDVLARFARGFMPLHPAELYAAGYTDIGTYQRTMHLALVYANTGDAATDAPEVLRRVTGFRLLRDSQPLIPTYASGATTRTLTGAGKGVLIVDIALLPDPPLSRFWLDTWQRGEIFLLLSPTAPGMPPPAMTVIPAPSGAPAMPPPAATPRP